jgi:hypothetical protein
MGRVARGVPRGRDGTMPVASHAEQQYFERVAEDCEELLGPGIELRALELDANELDANRQVVLRLRYRLGVADWTSEGHGETLIAAHAALREQLVLDRIRVGLRALVRQPR